MLGDVVAASSYLSQGPQKPFPGPGSPKPKGEAVASARTTGAEHKMLPPLKGSVQPTACYHNALEKEDHGGSMNCPGRPQRGYGLIAEHGDSSHGTSVQDNSLKSHRLSQLIRISHPGVWDEG